MRINNLSINTTFSCLILYTPTFNYFFKVFVFRRFRYIMFFTLFICISVENRLLILRHACNCGWFKKDLLYAQRGHWRWRILWCINVYHTCNTGSPLTRSFRKDPWFSLQLPVAWRRKSKYLCQSVPESEKILTMETERS